MAVVVLHSEENMGCSESQLDDRPAGCCMNVKKLHVEISGRIAFARNDQISANRIASWFETKG